ncbi:MAG: hypothetical protein ACREPM_10645 [Gemmatimonadaceae bacterium]
MDRRDQLQATIGGTYTIERELTGGGMSRVFAATESALARTVVIKVLPTDMAGQMSMDRFKRRSCWQPACGTPTSCHCSARAKATGFPTSPCRCLEKRAADRPQSASEIVHVLDDITTPSGGTAPLTAAAPVAPATTRAFPCSTC